MGYRTEILAPGHIYHVYSRGVNRRNIFSDDQDRQRFIDLLVYYLPRKNIGSFSVAVRRLNKQQRQEIIRHHKTKPGDGLVDLLCYCVMNNHFHLLVHENVEEGITTYLQRVLTGYAKYFNTRHEREGPLFSGRFRAVRVAQDNQFIHVTRYLHLNPYVARMVDDPYGYTWSSLHEYEAGQVERYCHTALLREIMKPKQYRAFVTNYADYARQLADIKDLTIEAG